MADLTSSFKRASGLNAGQLICTAHKMIPAFSFLRKLVVRAMFSAPAAHRFFSRLPRVWGLTADEQRGFASDRNY